MNLQAFQQPAQLPLINLKNLFMGLRPFESVLLQALLPQTKTVSVPIQYLHDIVPAVAKGKQVAGKWVQIQPAFNHDG
jgi:hypothetical protein